MELISRILDGSIPQDLKDALRRAEPAGPRMSHDEKIAHLEDVPLFADCSQKQLRSVSDISRVVEVPTGTSLTRAGQPGDEFFVLVDGTAAVEKPGKKKQFLRPGAFFGEMSLLDGGPRSVTVRAATPLRVLVTGDRFSAGESEPARAVRDSRAGRARPGGAGVPTGPARAFARDGRDPRERRPPRPGRSG